MLVKINESWKELLDSEFNSEYFKNLITFVKEDYSKTTCYPKGSTIFVTSIFFPGDLSATNFLRALSNPLSEETS